MRLGKYDVLGEIGRGGMGIVYRGFDPVLHRNVAIKTIKKDGAGEVALRLLNEARAAAHLQHPGIVEIYDFGEEEHVLFIVMELLEGEDLQNALDRQHLDVPALLQVLREVASALDFAHEKGVIHRDLKPSNIMVLPGGRSKLMDFGVAQFHNLSRLTLTGTIMGTPQYMSPEQVRGGEVEGASDQFALAAIAYQALTGEEPFGGGSFANVVHKIISGEYRSPSSLIPDLPMEAEQVLRRGLAPQPSGRYDNCASFVEHLATAVRSVSKLPTPATARSLQPTRVAAPAAPSPPSVAYPPPLPSVTVLANAAPASFADSFPKTGFFVGEQMRFSKIEESFRFFRDNLERQYASLSRQADVVWKLWAVCVGLGFLVLSTGLVFLFISKGEGTVTRGIVTAAASVLVYYIQRLFQQREDHYRRAAEEKNSHLEYGNKWLLVIQTVDAIQDPNERKRQQARIAEALSEHLSASATRASQKRTTPKRAARKPKAAAQD